MDPGQALTQTIQEMACELLEREDETRAADTGLPKNKEGWETADPFWLTLLT